MTDSSYYAPGGAGSGITFDNPVVINVPNDAPLGYYSSKGYKDTFAGFYIPDICNATPITFDKWMGITHYAILTKNYPVSGFDDGGGIRVWVYNSDADGRPMDLLHDLGTLAIPSTNPAVNPWELGVVEKTLDSTIYFSPNQTYWIVSSLGVDDGDGNYGVGPGAELAFIQATGINELSNYPLKDYNLTAGASAGALYIGAVQAAGGINATTTPASAGALYTTTNIAGSAPAILLKAFRD
jgi:hypothetical protein